MYNNESIFGDTIYKYYIENGQLKKMSTKNFKRTEVSNRTMVIIPAGELGLKTKKKILNELDLIAPSINGYNNFYTYADDDEYALNKFKQKMMIKQSQIETISKIINNIEIK